MQLFHFDLQFLDVLGQGQHRTASDARYQANLFAPAEVVEEVL